MEIMIIKSLEITDKDYIFIAPFLIIFAGAMLYLDTIFGKRKYAHLPIQPTDGAISINRILKKIRELFILLVLLVVAVTALNRIIGEGYLFSLVLLIIPVSLIWAGKIRKVKRYIVYVFHIGNEIRRDKLIYFSCFYQQDFLLTWWQKQKCFNVTNIYTSVSEQTLILFILIGLYFLVTSFIGFHPLVSIVLLAEILQPVLPEISSIPLDIRFNYI